MLRPSFLPAGPTSSAWALGTFLLAAMFAGCASHPPTLETKESTTSRDVRGFTILAINDVYRIEGVDSGTSGGMARLRALRQELEAEDPDLLFLHAGDLLFPSLLSRQYRGKQMIDALNHLDGDGEAMDGRMFATFGNHEFDRGKMQDAPLLDKRIRESQFRWLGTDITFAKGEDGHPVVAEEQLVRDVLIDSGGIRVGLFSLTTEADAPDYITAFADPTETARQKSAELRRRGAEVVVGLTHLTINQDEALLETLGDTGPDLIIGGHEHSQQHRQVGRRWVIKADAEARTASVVRITLVPDPEDPTVSTPRVDFRYHTLGPDSPRDPGVEQVVEAWLQKHDREYCDEELSQPPGCLAEVFGNSRVNLVGEELEIRRYETNLGNWLVDQARLTLAEHGAQIAIFNSGSFRLNQDLPPGPITRRHLEEIFQYKAELRLLEITGAQLRQVLEHSISDWTGNGHWLQVSGLAFRHDSLNDRLADLTYLGPEGPKPVRPKETFLLALGDYIAGGGDGYSLFPQLNQREYGEPVDLKDLAMEALKRAGEAGISPAVEGRICNTRRPGSCLAVAAE